MKLVEGSRQHSRKIDSIPIDTDASPPYTPRHSRFRGMSWVSSSRVAPTPKPGDWSRPCEYPRAQEC